MTGYIYLLTDLTNGKQYVGQHHYHKEELDPSYHGSGHIIKQIYNKRPETIKEEYVKTCYTQQEMDEWEKYFIFVNNTMYPNGYNLKDGGNGGMLCEESKRKIGEKAKGRVSPNKGKHFSEETRRKISEAAKKRLPPSEETRRKISEAGKGRHPSEETRQKLSKVKKKENRSDEYLKKISEKMTNNSKLSKPVLQFTLTGEFVKEWPSTKECGRNGFTQCAVWRCCNNIGHNKSHKGYIWRYKGVVYEEEINYKTPSQRTAEATSKSVLQYTKDDKFVREWPSMAEAGRNGFSYSAISHCCRGKAKTHKGFSWKYK